MSTRLEFRLKLVDRCSQTDFDRSLLAKFLGTGVRFKVRHKTVGAGVNFDADRRAQERSSRRLKVDPCGSFASPRGADIRRTLVISCARP